MTEHMEDEEKMGSDEDLAHAKEESKPKEPCDEDLVKDYLEGKS